MPITCCRHSQIQKLGLQDAVQPNRMAPPGESVASAVLEQPVIAKPAPIDHMPESTADLDDRPVATAAAMAFPFVCAPDASNAPPDASDSAPEPTQALEPTQRPADGLPLKLPEPLCAPEAAAQAIPAKIDGAAKTAVAAQQAVRIQAQAQVAAMQAQQGRAHAVAQVAASPGRSGSSGLDAAKQQALMVERQQELQRQQQADLEQQQRQQRERMQQLHLQQQQELQKELTRQHQWSFAISSQQAMVQQQAQVQEQAQVQAAAAAQAAASAQARMFMPAPALGGASGMLGGGDGIGLGGFGAMAPLAASTIAAAVQAVKEEMQGKRAGGIGAEAASSGELDDTPGSPRDGNGITRVPSLEQSMQSMMYNPATMGGAGGGATAAAGASVGMDTEDGAAAGGGGASGGGPIGLPPPSGYDPSSTAAANASMVRRTESAPVLSRMVSNSSSSSRLGAEGTDDGGLDWMFDVESVDAAIAAGVSALGGTGVGGGDGGGASHGGMGGGAGGSSGSVGHATGLAGQMPLGMGGHTSISVNDFSSIRHPASPGGGGGAEQLSPGGGAGGAGGTAQAAAAGEATGVDGQSPNPALQFDMSLSELDSFDFDLYDSC